jgi:glycosyltransferase involved in cell wall biosynthesis
MSGTPLVSIITPSFNQGRYIEDTIRSIVAQDYPRIEHIVCDGGSTDQTVEILERYRRIGRLSYTSGRDGGQAAAINSGFARAQGDIVTWLNSDDVYVFTDAVSTMVRAFDQNPAIDFIYGDFIEIDADNTVQRVLTRPPRFSRERLLRIGYISQPATFFRRRVVAKLQLDPSLRIALDLDFWLRASGAGLRFQHIRKVVAAERLHDSAKCVAEAPRLQAEARAVRERYGERFDRRHHVLRAIDRAVLAAYGLLGLLPWPKRVPLAVRLHRPPLLKYWMHQLRLQRSAS